MSIEEAERVLDELLKALGWLIDEYAKSESPWGDQGDLDWAVSEVHPLLEALADKLREFVDRELKASGADAAELDEVLSFMGQQYGVDDAVPAAEAASRLLYFIQCVSYGQHSDPDGAEGPPDLEGDTGMLEEGVRAILTQVQERSNE